MCGVCGTWKCFYQNFFFPGKSLREPASIPHTHTRILLNGHVINDVESHVIDSSFFPNQRKWFGIKVRQNEKQKNKEFPPSLEITWKKRCYTDREGTIFLPMFPLWRRKMLEAITAIQRPRCLRRRFLPLPTFRRVKNIISFFFFSLTLEIPPLPSNSFEIWIKIRIFFFLNFPPKNKMNLWWGKDKLTFKGVD